MSMGLLYSSNANAQKGCKKESAGISKCRLEKGVPHGTRNRLPIPIIAQLLGDIHGFMKKLSMPEKVLLWAIASTAFFGFFRLGELWCLSDQLSRFPEQIMGNGKWVMA